MRPHRYAPRAPVDQEAIEAAIRRARQLRSEFFAAALERLVKAFIRWNQRNALNRRLQALPDYLLKDIGIGRGQIPAVVSGALKRQASPLAEAVSQGSLSFLDAKKRRAGNTDPDTEKALAA